MLLPAPLGVSQDQVTEHCTSSNCVLMERSPQLLQNTLDNSSPWLVGMCSNTILGVCGGDNLIALQVNRI